MPSFPGSQGALPGPYVDVVTQSRGVSIPGGLRLAAIVGEGQRVERLVSTAVGSGNDGLGPDYSSTSGRNGRRFKLSLPAISNRTTLYKNGVTLSGLEQSFNEDSGSFSSIYDYRLDISTGNIELQAAALVDQGGTFYSASALNVGNGTISNLTLEDENAFTETWTVRCISVRRDGYGDPIDGYAKFIAQGSISGVLLDGYGNQITWNSDGVEVSNSVLSFSIEEGVTNFQEGDKFTIRVRSGALSRGDSLVATYISEIGLNDPEFFTDFDSLTTKHGAASTSNRLSLAAQLAFANGPPGVWACQAAPAVPRRISYNLEASASGGSTSDDLQFPLPLNVVPDTDTNINFFVTDPATGAETQIFPNKVSFFNSTYTTSPAAFHTGETFAYTVVLEDAVVKDGDDGELVANGPLMTFSSATVLFDSTDVGKTLKILEPAANAGSYTIASVADGEATVNGSFVSEDEIEFEVIDADQQTAQILFTQDLAPNEGESLRATIVDTRDADFFDANWTAAFEALEVIECDIVVPVPSQTISNIFQAAKAHCVNMSSIRNKKERVLFIGALAGLNPENVIGTEDAAVEDIGILEGIQGDDVSEIIAGNIEDLANYSVENAFGDSFRVVYFYPDEIVVQIGADRVAVDGFFMAAAAAGYLSAQPNVAIPLTNKTLAGFTILRSKQYRQIILEQLSAKGITVVQPVTGGGRVIWGKTTTNSGFVEEQEISIVFIRDQIAKALREAFKGFIGQPETRGFAGTLLARASSLLQGFIAQGLISDFRDLRIVRNATDPTQWDIAVAVQPIFPVNFIYLRVSVGRLD